MRVKERPDALSPQYYTWHVCVVYSAANIQAQRTYTISNVFTGASFVGGARKLAQGKQVFYDTFDLKLTYPAVLSIV